MQYELYESYGIEIGFFLLVYKDRKPKHQQKK